MKNISLTITAALLFLCLGIPAGVMGQDYMEDLQIHGLISQGFIYSDEYNYLTQNSTDGSFEYNELGINFAKQLTPKLGFGIQFFARDIGDAANNKVTLDWAYGDYRAQDWLGLRFGKIKLPLGLWSEIRDYDILRPWIVLPQNSVYADLNRDAFSSANGLGLYGNVPMGAAGNLDYYLVGGNLNSDMESGVAKYMGAQFGTSPEIFGESKAEMVFSGSLRWNTPLAGLMIGIWGANPETTIPFGALEFKTESTFSGVMVEYLWGNISLWAEYMSLDADIAVPGLVDTSVRPENYYLGLAYQFALWFQVGAYYSEYYFDGDDKDGSDITDMNPLFSDHKAWEKDLALTFRFDLNEYWVLKLEGHMVDGTTNVSTNDNPDSDLKEQNFYYGVAKLSVSF